MSAGECIDVTIRHLMKTDIGFAFVVVRGGWGFTIVGNEFIVDRESIQSGSEPMYIYASDARDVAFGCNRSVWIGPPSEPSGERGFPALSIGVEAVADLLTLRFWGNRLDGDQRAALILVIENNYERGGYRLLLVFETGADSLIAGVANNMGWCQTRALKVTLLFDTKPRWVGHYSRVGF